MRIWSAALLLGSLAALVGILVYGATTGFVREVDEGTAAHLWQLLMAAQVPLGVLFAAAWLPQAPRRAWAGLGLEAGVVVLNLAVVRYFGL